MLCCYFPTTIAAIDDDADFLKTINVHLKLSNCLLFTSPESAISSLINQMPCERIKSRLMTSFIDNTTLDFYTHSINLRNLHHEIYNAARFQDLSVIIVDYYMGETNGIELCQKLFNHPAKKILLTGGVDKEKIAIDAFNKGIIHHFINKADANFPLQLRQTIAALKKEYFNDLTKAILPNISLVTKLLENTIYINFIHDLQNQLNAEEFYLLDISGSMIFLDAQGKATWLIVKEESELNYYEKIALDSDTPHLFVDEIRSHNKIPFFFLDEDYQQPVHNWGKYLYNATKLPGLTGVYYALINDNRNIDCKNINSYESYITNIKIRDIN